MTKGEKLLLEVCISNIIENTYNGCFPISEISSSIRLLVNINKEVKEELRLDLKPELLHFSNEWGFLD